MSNQAKNFLEKYYIDAINSNKPDNEGYSSKWEKDIPRFIPVSQELKHFGIKGMKWGVWNDETKARYSGSRRERYKRGKKYALEMQNKQNKEFNKLFNESSQKKKTLRKEAIKIANKYGLDYNDGSWDDDTKFSGKELQKARREYLNKIEELESIDDRNKAESVKRAAKYITDKYGSTAVKDISFFNVATAYMVAGGVTVGSAITLTAAALLLK